MQSNLSMAGLGRRLLWMLLCLVETLPLFAAVPPQTPDKVNVILIVLDQLRAERLHQGAGQWHTLGTFPNPRYARLTNAANGAVIADAVRFERLHW